jgi:hypothetical protein
MEMLEIMENKIQKVFRIIVNSELLHYCVCITCLFPSLHLLYSHFLRNLFIFILEPNSKEAEVTNMMLLNRI